jgi:hypothetical protein
MPDAYLDELNADDRAAYWRRQVLALLPGQRLKVIVDDGVVVGFAAATTTYDATTRSSGSSFLRCANGARCLRAAQVCPETTGDNDHSSRRPTPACNCKP